LRGSPTPKAGAIHTLGKIGPKDNAHHLRQPRFREWRSPEDLLADAMAHPSLSLRFEALEQEVGSYLWTSGERDYDLELVEAVARHTETHPIVPGWYPETYWAPVIRARRAAAAHGENRGQQGGGGRDHW
jgi:hypothetical protein